MVRTRAVEWLRDLGSDELLAYLPQLVQAVKHETWDDSAVVRLLLERSITCPRLAHHLYWLLNQCLPQQVWNKYQLIKPTICPKKTYVMDNTLRKSMAFVPGPATNIHNTEV